MKVIKNAMSIQGPLMRERDDVALYMTPFKLSDAWKTQARLELSWSMSLGCVFRLEANH